MEFMTNRKDGRLLDRQQYEDLAQWKSDWLQTGYFGSNPIVLTKRKLNV